MTIDVIPRTEYPVGVPCWIDTEQPDPDAAAEFYGELFGWELEDRLPRGSGERYLVARLHGRVVGGIASPLPDAPSDPAWNTYVRVDDADATAEQARASGAEIVVAPVDAGEAGRFAVLTDPNGARFRVWQPNRRRGAELVNSPGSWNSSDLVTGDPDAAARFYGGLFGWSADAIDFGDAASDGYMWRLPGYGDFLAIRDPDIRRRHAEPWVPEGFSDAIGWMTVPTEDDAERGSDADRRPTWTVTFTVEHVDAVVEAVQRLGGTVVSPAVDVAGGVVRTATVRDPQGAEFIVSSYDPTP